MTRPNGPDGCRLSGGELRLSAHPTHQTHLEEQRRAAVGVTLASCTRLGFTAADVWETLAAIGLWDTAVGMVEAARDARMAVQEPGGGTNRPALVSGELHAEDSSAQSASPTCTQTPGGNQ